MGKRRVIAETGAGQHGVATATACALLGLECVVYMGTEDMRRQRPNVERMGLLGARVEPVEAGARTLKEAVSAAIRDWVANVETTHYVIGSAVGPAPYPALVRDLQRVIGDEARAQMLERTGALPDRVVACVGGGSNAIGTFYAFLDDDGRRAGRRRGRRARGSTAAATAPRSAPGSEGVLHGALSSILQDDDGQILEAHSVSAGLDYPGVGPEHAHLRDSGPRALRVRHRRRRRWTHSAQLSRLEGIIPALEPAHAIAWLLGGAGRRRSSIDAPRPQRPRRQGPRRGARPAGRRVSSALAPARSAIAQAFAAHGRRAALMPYLMGGFPTLGGVAASGGGLRRRRRGPGRARRAVLGPARGRPRDPGGRPARAGGGRDVRATCSSEVAAPLRAGVPVVLMCYSNPLLRARLRGGRRGARRSGRRRPDRARHAGRRGGRAARRCATRPASRSCRSSRRRRRRSRSREIAAAARGFVYVVSVTGVTGERGELPPELADVVERVRARRPTSRSRSASGRDARAGGRVGEIADGVIIGSRLVRAVAEAGQLDAGLADVGLADVRTCPGRGAREPPSDSLDCRPMWVFLAATLGAWRCRRVGDRPMRRTSAA